MRRLTAKCEAWSVCPKCSRQFASNRIGSHINGRCGVTSEDLFWAKVVKQEDGCWVWQGAYRRDGYGHLAIRHKSWSAHKYAYTITKGPIPTGRWVLHSCDVRGCCNPDHLRLGDRAENMRDMADRGRSARTGAKLTPEQVREIRRDYKLIGRIWTNAPRLAEKYGIGLGAIHNIARGITWSKI